MTSIASAACLNEPEGTLNRRAVGERFGRAATSYDAHAHLQLACARTLLEMAPAVLADRRALELGCATAPLARAQRARWPDSRWLAVDLSPAMLGEARERGRTGADFQPLCADAEHLPLADAGCGLVFSSFALQWCAPERVAAEVARVLMPGGSFLLAVPLAGSLHEMTASWAAADRRPHVNRLPTEQHWRAALADAGLMPSQWQCMSFTEHYPDVKKLVRAFKATGVDHVQGGANGLTGKTAWRAMAQAYEQRRQPAGLPLTWEVLFLEAEKACDVGRRTSDVAR